MNNDINILNTFIKDDTKNNEKSDNILKLKTNNYSFNFF